MQDSRTEAVSLVFVLVRSGGRTLKYYSSVAGGFFNSNNVVSSTLSESIYDILILQYINVNKNEQEGSNKRKNPVGCYGKGEKRGIRIDE